MREVSGLERLVKRDRAEIMKSHGGVRGENRMNFSPITDEEDNL